MMLRALGLLAILGLAAGPVSSQNQTSPTAPLRDPAFSARGDLAVELAGEIWVAPAAQWKRNGLAALRARILSAATHRHPSWSADGKELYLSSNPEGQWDIYRWREPAGLERMTTSELEDSQPCEVKEGAVVFVRDLGSRRRLWIRNADGREKPLTGRDAPEFSPGCSPDGSAVAYVTLESQQRQLRIFSIEDGGSRVVLENRAFAAPGWSPDSQYLIFSTTGGSAGVWLTDVGGSFTNLIAAQSATAAWPPEGRLLLIEHPPSGPGYNGNPARVDNRDQQAVLLADPPRIWSLEPPRPPARHEQVASMPPFDQALYRRQALEQIWQRLQSLYFTSFGRSEWEALRDEYLPRARDLTDPADLDELVYEMLSRRPAIRPEARGRAAVSSAHPEATAAGVEILNSGGNVVEAAIAVSFALGVVEPDASGIGGYGEMLVFLEGMDEPVAIEFLTRVPAEATLNNAAVLGQRLPRDGPKVVNVPGTVAGMWTAWERFGGGRLEWSRLLEPAIRLADEGFVLDDAFPTTLQLEQERFLRYPSSAALFFPDGQPLAAGDRLRNEDLAWTLRQIADGGAAAFYKGAVARRLVQDLRGQGSPLSATDLSRYFAAVRRPVAASYRGHTIYGSVPAASGGAMLAAKLKLLEQHAPLRPYPQDASTLHAMIEAWKLTPSSRGRIADPGLWPTETAIFTDADRARRVWSRCFSPERSLTPEDLRRGDGELLACEQEEATDLAWGVLIDCPEAVRGLPCRATGTTSFAVADARGNMVSVTQTLGTWGGNFYVSPGLGFLYNDKLRSYGTDPQGYNARLPYARNGTSIAPTLVFSGTGSAQRPRAALGAAGNAWITSAVYQTLVGIVDFGLGPQEALELPRFLVGRGGGGRPAVVQAEDGLAPGVVRRLRELGHRIRFISLPGELRMGYGAAVVVDGDSVRAGADPRRSGSAAAIQ